MGTSAFVMALVAISTVGQAVTEKDRTHQNDAFKKWWGTEFVWKFDELPDKGSVEDFRVPYSGYIYPDTGGGTMSALRKYDRAFHGNRLQATSYERWDTSLTESVPTVRRGLFGRTFTSYSRGVPHWYGHCNGWTSASIRHAEPVNNVVRNGVTFTPADIKGLLAELYIYNEMDVLAGSDSWLNPGTLHAILTNWVGRGNHPMGMEADPGKEKWNYPIFAYATTSARRSNGQIEVKMNVAYAKDSRGEFQQSPRNKAQKFFHYALNLDENGMITGGSFYGDSSRIDMLWIPLSPKESKTPGHERGNPYITVNDIVSIWRDSVPEETRRKWFTIDPLVEDRITDVPEGLAKLIPLQKFEIPQPAEPAANVVAATTIETTTAPAADATAAVPATTEASAAATTPEVAPTTAASETPAETGNAPAAEANDTATSAGE